MKNIVSVIVIVILFTFSSVIIIPGQSDCRVLDKFLPDNNQEVIITFNSGGGSDNSTYIFIEKGAPVYYGYVNITGLPDGSGNYPTNVDLDVGDDDIFNWQFNDVGYGPLGKQTVFSDDNSSRKLVVSETGYGQIGSIKIPINATVTKATFDITYGTDVMTIQPGPGAGKDARTQYENPNTNYGSDEDLQFFDMKTHSFLEFDLSTIPVNADISTAYLRLFSHWWGDQRTYGVHRVLQQWWENNITWNNRPSVAGTALDTEVFQLSPNWKTLDISQAMINWWSSTWSNYGIVMKETTNQTDMYYIKSNDHWNSSLHPNVEVNFIIYPINPGIKIGMGGGSPDWDFSSELQSVVTTRDLSTELNNYLSIVSSGNVDEYGNEMVEIPITVFADNNGSIVTIENIQVEYDYIARANITAGLNANVPNDPFNEGGYEKIPLVFASSTGGKLKVDGLFILYNHRPLLQSLDDPKITSINDQILPEDCNNPEAIDLGYYFQDDLDANTSLKFHVIRNNNPDNIQVTVNPDKQHYLYVKALSANWTGSTTVQVNCTDSGGRWINSNEFKITLESVNDKPAPNIEIPDKTLDEDGTDLTIDLDQVNYFIDDEGDTIYFDVDVDPLDSVPDEKISCEIDEDNTLIIRALENYYGSGVPIWIYADDGIYNGTIQEGTVAKYGSGKPYSYQEILVNIKPLNDAPIWTEINDTYIDEDIAINDYINLYDYVYDPESPKEELALSVHFNENSSEINVEIDKDKNLDISFVGENYCGQTFVTLKAEDGDGAKSYEIFNIIVRPINDVPVVKLDSHAAGQKVSGVIDLKGTATDVDGTVASVEIRFDKNPYWLAVLGTESWFYRWDTTTVNNGLHDIHIRAMDDSGEYSNNYSVTLNVEIPPNIVPKVEITEPENDTIIFDGEVIIRGTARDMDGGITLIQIRLEDGEWQDVEGSIDWYFKLNTSNLTSGLYNVYVRSTDGLDYSVEKNIIIQVVNQPPNYKDDDDDFDNKRDTTDKSGTDKESNLLYIIIILVVVIIIVMALIGIFVRKKKKADAPEKEFEDKAEDVPLEGAPQLPGTPSPSPVPVEPGSPEGTVDTPPPPTPLPVPEGVPQPIQLPSYPVQEPEQVDTAGGEITQAAAAEPAAAVAVIPAPTVAALPAPESIPTATPVPPTAQAAPALPVSGTEKEEQEESEETKNDE